MRIIGGNLRGKKILLPLDKSTRPLKDVVRESIFNILRHSKKESVNLNKSIVLDLFSGTGSFGIECLSRGAEKVFFFENYSKSLQILNKNINNLNLTKKIKILQENVYEIDKINLNNASFDLIFLDPPFKDNNINVILNKIKTTKLINKNTIIIIHRNKKIKEIISNNLKILREEYYGTSKIIFGKLI